MKAEDVTNDFPIVCVGGSAGGLDAYIRLLRNLPADLGVAVVIVNHLIDHELVQIARSRKAASSKN